jgi:hypothetical protein
MQANRPTVDSGHAHSAGALLAFGLQLNMQVRYSALTITLSLAHVQFSRGVKYSLRRAVIGISVSVCC